MSFPHLRAVLLVLVLALPLGFVGAAPTVDSDRLAGYPEGSYVLEDGAIAVPLGLPTPSDYTAEIHAKVLAAAENGNGYDPVADKEVALAVSYLFIRPGAWMWSPSWCTMNFIYGTPGSYKIGSAGHCNARGQDVVIVLAYPQTVFVKIGKTEASHNNGIGDDWSVTAISSNMQQHVDANVAVINGPQGGAYTGSIFRVNPVVAKHFGHGMGIGTAGTPRAGEIGFSPNTGTAWYCDCVVVFGDSGGPMLAVTPAAPLGQAMGAITHLVVGSIFGTSAGTRADAIPYTVRDGDVNPLPPA